MPPDNDILTSYGVPRPAVHIPPVLQKGLSVVTHDCGLPPFAFDEAQKVMSLSIAVLQVWQGHAATCSIN